MINFPANMHKNSEATNGFLKAAIEAIAAARSRQAFYGGNRFEQIISEIGQIETLVQGTVTQIGKIKADNELKSEIGLEKMGALADVARAKKKQTIDKIMKMCEDFGAKWTLEALPRMPKANNGAEQLGMIQGLKGDIRMVLDAASEKEFRDVYGKLVSFYQERGNSLAIWLLCGSDYIELYAGAMKPTLIWTLADQWQVYKSYASDLQQEAADLAALMSDYRLQPGGTKPFELRNIVTVPEALVMIDRGFDYALDI